MHACYIHRYDTRHMLTPHTTVLHMLRDIVTYALKNFSIEKIDYEAERAEQAEQEGHVNNLFLKRF